MGCRAVGLPLPPAIAAWIATSPATPPPDGGPASYPWSANRLAPEPPGEWKR